MPLWCRFFALAVVAAAQSTVTFRPSVNVTDAKNASAILSPSFIGMGVEPNDLFAYTGTDSRNDYVYNLLNTLANYTGIPPHLRIGGNTGDNMIYDPSYQEFNLAKNPHPTGSGNYPSDSLTFGPTYFQALDRFPKGTPLSFGVNLAFNGDGYIDHIVQEAAAALTLLKNVDLVGYEIGNEPDLYTSNHYRNQGWDGSDYAREWVERASAIYHQVLKPRGISPSFFEPACTAVTLGNSFQIDLLAQTELVDPVPDTKNKSYIATWNQHYYYYYIGSFPYTLYLNMLMDLSTTVGHFADWEGQVQQALATGHPYALREMATVGPAGETGLSDVFGATLWTLNFFLYAAASRISSVQVHMTTNSYAAPFQPIEVNGQGPHVNTIYYAFAAMDQLIGAGCNTQVSQLSIDSPPTEYVNHLAAYATYRSGTLAALVMINTKMANVSVANKGSAMFAFSLPSLKGKDFYVSLLTADGADAKTGTTWNGISYEKNDDGTPFLMDNSTQKATVGSDGMIYFSVRDTQAIVANLGSQVGSINDYDAAACRKLASTSAEGGNDVLQEHTVAPYTFPAPTSTSSPAPSPTRTNVVASATGGISNAGSGNASAPPAALGPPGARPAPLLILAALVGALYCAL